ncbi:hypothetical protein SAMN05519103_04558 [Rhizobiales bacterium GAS113]|nr:hypothetical protein SAMN05519103_04558 [Rhizobiales bacterium GAS113]
MSAMTKAEIQAHLDRDLRLFTAEMLDGTARNASIAVQFLEMGDDTGAEYAIRRAAAHFRAAVDVMARLKARKRATEAADAG